MHFIYRGSPGASFLLNPVNAILYRPLNFLIEKSITTKEEEVQLCNLWQWGFSECLLSSRQCQFVSISAIQFRIKLSLHCSFVYNVCQKWNLASERVCQWSNFASKELKSDKWKLVFPFSFLCALIFPQTLVLKLTMISEQLIMVFFCHRVMIVTVYSHS